MSVFSLTRPIGLQASAPTGFTADFTSGGAALTATLSGPASTFVGVTTQFTLTLSSNAAQEYTVTWAATGGAALSVPSSTIGVGQRSTTVSATWAASTTGSISASLTPTVTVSGTPVAVTVLTAPVQTFTGKYKPYLVHPRSKGNTGVEELYDGSSGPDRRTFSQHIQCSWENLNGDYIDKGGIKYNGTNAATMIPWHTFVVADGTQPGYISTDLTDLCREWLTSGHNRGATFVIDNTSNNSAYVFFAGTFTDTPPKVVVTTSTGVKEYVMDLAGWATGSDNGDDSRYTRRMSRVQRCIGQCEFLDEATGTFISAQLRMYVQSMNPGYPLTVKVFLTDPPPLLLGRAGKPVVLGIADEVGEMAIQGSPWKTPSPHPDVWAAGDFRMRNIWSEYRDNDSATGADMRYPADLFNNVSIKQDQRQATEFWPDYTHAPGTTEYRGVLLTTQIGAGTIKHTLLESLPDQSDPLRRIKATCPKEVFVRQYIYFEKDFVSGDSDQFGFKMGLGLDAQFGLGSESGLGWSEAAGSGQSDSYGCKFKWWSYPSTRDPLLEGATEGDVWYQVDKPKGTKFKLAAGLWVKTGRYTYAADADVPDNSVRWCYEGHSFRAHSGSFMGTTNTKYPNVIALLNACSHIGNPPSTVSPLVKGTFDTGWDGGVYGTEQTLRIGNGVHNKFSHVFEIERWYCVEAQLKMNTVDTSVTDANGNGRARNDGVLRYWIDGAMVGERTTMAWANHPDLGIEGSYFIMYHGGVAGPIDPDLGLPTGYPNAPMHYRLNNFVIAKRYIGPHVARNYPAGVNPPEDPPATGGDLTNFAQTIGLAAAPPNSWIDTRILPNGCWAVKSMVDGGRYATQAEVEPGPADRGNFNGTADDTMVNSNGAAWDPVKNQFYWRGGGHGGWMGGEWYWMDVATMKMGRMTNPPPMARWPEGPTGWGWKNLDGSPVSYHTYNGMVFVPPLNAIFTLFGSPWPDGGRPNSDMWRFDLATKQWTKVFTNVMAPLDEKIGPCAHWNPTYQKIAVGEPNYWRWFDPFTNTVGKQIVAGLKSFGNSVDTPEGIYGYGRAEDPITKLDTATIHRIAHNQIGVSAPVSMKDLCPRIYAHPRFRDANFEWNSFIYDSKRKMVISWDAAYNSEPTTGRKDVGKHIYGIDYVNDHLYEFVTPVGNRWSESRALGSYTKFQYIAALDCYIGANNRLNLGNGWMVFKPGTPTRLT